MRPRFANRGSELAHVYSTFPIMASMRPRFANRGSGRTQTECGCKATCFNEAPIRESGKWLGDMSVSHYEIMLQ